MTFHFSRYGLSGTERRVQRVLEMLPGLTSWTLLVGMILLAFWKPLVAAVLVIVIDFYWLLRLLYMTCFLIMAFGWLSIERNTDWMARVRAIDRLAVSPQALIPTLGGALRQWWSLQRHRCDVEALRRSGARPPSSEEVRHVVIIPVAKEDRTVIEPGIESLAQQTFPTNQLLVILALEARAPQAVKDGVEAVRQRFHGAFLDLLVAVHPDGLPGEARVKGANVTHAAKAAVAWVQAQGVPFERVLVSCFDADTVVSPHYMACLTYHFLISPDRTRASFQPIPVYHNNIWDAPGFARVLDIGSSFFQLIEATNPEKLVTFSSHSMSFQALVEVGYWPVDIISDDSAIFWKAFIHYDGRYRVVPMYVTVSMDVVSAGSWWRTAVAVYRQKRRWAWGVENFPLVGRAFLRAAQIPRYHRLRLLGKLFEGHLGWATWPFLVMLIGWLPAVWAGREFSSTVLYYSAPRITATIFRLASVSLVITIVLSWLLLPRGRVRRPLVRSLGLALEWLLVPLSAMFLSALPALDAQTRLLCGRSMEFWVADKARPPRPAPTRV